MTEHLSTELVNRFQQQSLIAPERTVVRDHLMMCVDCRHLAIDEQLESSALAVLTNDLLLSEGEGPYHSDFETIAAYVEGTLEPMERTLADIHFEMCSECSDEVKDLGESLATIEIASVRQFETSTKRRGPTLTNLPPPVISRSLRLSAIVALAVVAIVAAIVILRARIDSNRGPKEPQIVGPLPSPNELPKDVQATSSPTPIPSRSPGRPLEQRPPNQFSQLQAIALSDGPLTIVIDRSGKLRGLDTLPRETQQAIAEVLIAQTIKRPDVLNELDDVQVSSRGPSENADTAKILYPANRVITEDEPVFAWEPAKDASGYRVEIGDNLFRSVAKSDLLPSTSHFWTPSTPLQRGGVYNFTIRVFKEGDERGSITSPKSFKILDEQSMTELTRIKATSKSHLALGVFYAREGMLDKAVLEFEELAKANPQTTLPKKLIRLLRSWR